MVKERTKMDRAIERFLKDGHLSGFSPDDMARASDQRIRAVAESSAELSLDLGRKFIRQSRKYGGNIQITALRVNGWVSLVAGKYDDARLSYLEARSLVRGNPVDRARIDRVLIDVFMYLADFKEARRRARMALATFRRFHEPGDLAKTEVNFANLLHRQDLHREAQKLYQRAAGYFEKAGPPTAAALCYYNVANTQVQLFQFDAARDTYTRAKTIFEKSHHTLHATGCLYGLSWLKMLEGSFHVALRQLAECEKQYLSGGHTRELILCQLDQAEAYLYLNLSLYARQAAEKASREAAHLGIVYEEAKGNFFSGLASMRLGCQREARRALQAAYNGFEKERNQGFLAAVEMALVQSASRKQPVMKPLLAARERLKRAQLPLWEAICDLQILSNKPDDSLAAVRLSRNRAVAVVPHLAARRYAVLGDRAASRGFMSKAVTYWTRAADILEAVRAKLPPTELRTSFLSQDSGPYEMLIAAEHERNPMAGALWSEHYRSAGVWSTADHTLIANNPARLAVEASHSALAEQVAAISRETFGSSGTRSAGIMSNRLRFNKLQADAHRAMIALDRPGSSYSRGYGDLENQIRSLSHKSTLIQFHVGCKDIFAFVQYKGNTLSHCYRDGVQYGQKLAARWRFLVERVPNLRNRADSRHLADEKRLLEQIGEWLLAPLQLPEKPSHLLVIPEGLLANLPWSALQYHNLPLIDRFTMTLAPSIRHHLHARAVAVQSNRARVFVGEIKGLPHVKDELEAISKALGGLDVSYYSPCRRADWPDHDRAMIWHFAGHARLRADNPYYSALMLDDGPFFAADFRLKRCRVALVTLAACRTGQQLTQPGEETGGLVRSLLEMGARNVIASHWAVSDDSTRAWSVELYRHFLNGVSVAEAMQKTTRNIRELYPSAYHWSAFSVFGAGK
jgi:CHAT domain-containing protein/tetratricopeptide (TPR) repeat protein